jgi:uncharacterized protein YhhL (DUF1145 family)
VKLAVIALWLVAAASFLLPEGSSLAYWGHRLFFGLVIVHAIECLVFLPRLRAAGGSLANHLWNTFVFGVVHVHTVPRTAVVRD